MTPKEMAKIVLEANRIREASFNTDGAKHARPYNKSWHKCYVEAGCPQDWLGLIVPYATLGYSDLYDWAEEM